MTARQRRVSLVCSVVFGLLGDATSVGLKHFIFHRGSGPKQTGRHQNRRNVHSWIAEPPRQYSLGFTGGGLLEIVLLETFYSFNLNNFLKKFYFFQKLSPTERGKNDLCHQNPPKEANLTRNYHPCRAIKISKLLSFQKKPSNDPPPR